MFIIQIITQTATHVFLIIICYKVFRRWMSDIGNLIIIITRRRFAVFYDDITL